MAFILFLSEIEEQFYPEQKRAHYGRICQCEYGQSRSAACAAAILEAFDNSGIEIFADYRYYPNQLIFNKLRKALEKRKGTKKTDS